MWMYPVAIACGNTFVLKPSERDPSASMLHRRAVAPRPACPTASSTSCTATRWPSTRCSTTPTSRRSRSSARRRSRSTSTSGPPRNGKRVQALGGAKNHAIVLPDADLDFAADHLAAAAFGSAGRALHGDLRRRRGRRRRRRAGRRGRATQAARGQGRPRPRRRTARWARSSPAQARDRIVGLIGTGEEQGATARRRRPRPASSPGHEDGFFVGPTVIDQVTPEMDVYREEIFGPVLSVLRVDDRRRGDRPDQRQPLRQRHGDLHLAAARRRAGSSAASTSG